MIFKADWITYKTGEYKSADDKYGNPSPYFRKTFCVEKPVKKATLSVAALGVFKAYLNGQAVAEDYLSPGWVDYRKKLPVIEYDITDRVGDKNAVSIVLGDGWAVGHLGSTYAFKRNGYSDRIELMAVVDIEYTDGTREVINTDDSWKATIGAIRRSDIYMGEYIDSRCDLGDFSAVDYDDSKWDNAEKRVFKFSRNILLYKTDVPLTVVKHRLTPELVSTDGVLVYDFKQNFAGVVSCDIKGEPDTVVTFCYGEMMVDGKVYRDNLRKAEATDTFVLGDKGVYHFRPLFTYHGFRYMEVSVDGNAQVFDVVGESMYSDLKATGDFSCSDEVVNRVFKNALWSQRDNFINLPTDCPQRDERLGWVGDSQIFCQSAMYNMDCRLFYKKHLADIRDAQLGNGAVPAVAPVPPVGFNAYTGYDAPAGWSEAIAVIPMTLYKMYGDEQVIRENLPNAKRLLDYYIADSDGFLRDGLHGYGDWLSVGEVTDKGVVTNLYFAYMAKLTAEMCRIIGDTEAPRYDRLFECVSSAFKEKYVDGDGKIFSDTQSSYILAYSFGLLSANEVKSHIVRKFQESKGFLTTGFLGVKYLLPTLCELGLDDLAYGLLVNREYPGWGYSVVNGATTIWERWNSYTREGGISKEGMNSFNHYSLGSCVEWMYEYALGIRPDAPGFKRAVMKPYFDRRLRITEAQGFYDTDFGRISVRWEYDKKHWRYEVEIPKEIEAEVEFLNAETVEEYHEGTKHIYVLK
ncbi:MAG: family 78 glycoside hydrolase catalytic domain [Clostridia bacterium]|nr:family 78 glycoside hydrolase catalytic domain [Clostridia bacterium]